MKLIDTIAVKPNDKGQTAFSALTVAGHLLIKLKKKMKMEYGDMGFNKKTNYNLASCLSKCLSKEVEFELEQLKKEIEEKPLKEKKDLLLLADSSHFKEFLQSLLDYFKVILCM